MRIEIPKLSVVALVGVSGSGKSTLAARHFKPTEVLSSDYFRALVSDDENNADATMAAFDSLHYVAHKRLTRGLLTVIDATNTQQKARTPILQLAKDHDCHAVAIVVDLPLETIRARNQARTDRTLPDYALTRQHQQLRHSLKFLHKEGFRRVYVLDSEQAVAELEIVRTPLWNDKTDDSGPFDIIGDVHGCYDELTELLGRLGYTVDVAGRTASHPQGRRAVFVGDLTDRGPRNADVLALVMAMVNSGAAYCVCGNHDAKLLRILRGNRGQLTHGLDLTMAEMEAQPPEFKAAVISFLDSLISHYVFDEGRLVVAHAGLIERYQGRASGRVRAFCLYGDVNGEKDEYGLPVRLPWANDYRGKALVVYGHTPADRLAPINNTICIDTGCVFGGHLTAYRYPEGETVQVAAARQYCDPIKPLGGTPRNDDLLSIDDVQGQRRIDTRLRGVATIAAENSAAALEVMSRFAVDPRWLIYLPPTMSPVETSGLPDYLEHPEQAFDYYGKRGVNQVVCEVKHMGSRAVIILCRDAEAALRRFGADDGSIGVIHTRTGRQFFDDRTTQDAILTRLAAVLEATAFWSEFDTDWVCLDTELMPWSAKARRLLATQYAPVGRSGRNALASAIAAIEQAGTLGTQAADAQSSSSQPAGLDMAELLSHYHQRAEALDAYTAAYRRYCWEVATVDDYRIAPFHILATAGRTHTDQTHLWQMSTINQYITGRDPIFIPTDHRLIDLTDPASRASGVSWWQELTEAGGEGMVVKPLDFIATRGTELLQPAVKCRGREYLRIIYGPEYLLPANLPRLKQRNLTKKRGLALREFALGIESLERQAKGDPLYKVHECVFAVLALESEPVDPRL